MLQSYTFFDDLAKAARMEPGEERDAKIETLTKLDDDEIDIEKVQFSRFAVQGA